jgi:hypothetical protein
MEGNQKSSHRIDDLDNKFRSGQHLVTARRFAPAIAIAVFLTVGGPTIAMVDHQDGPAAKAVEASTDIDLATAELTTPPTPASLHRGGVGRPDRVGDFVGGIAARLYSDDGERIPGDVFLLMAVAGSDADARVYDRTPHPRDGDQIHPEVIESNHQAVRTVTEITGTDLQMVDFTSAPGGGLSAGVTYAIAYLNIISDGAFTGDLVVAATGRLESHGYVYPINAVNEKTAAAHLAGADVLFTPTIPAAELIDVHGTRVVGELFRARNTGSTLTEERQWSNYGRWGASRPDNDMDTVGIRHIGDVAAYLCGAGSDFACDITHVLENVVTDTSTKTGEATPATGQNNSTKAKRGRA